MESYLLLGGLLIGELLVFWEFLFCNAAILSLMLVGGSLSVPSALGVSRVFGTPTCRWIGDGWPVDNGLVGVWEGDLEGKFGLLGVTGDCCLEEFPWECELPTTWICTLVGLCCCCFSGLFGDSVAGLWTTTGLGDGGCIACFGEGKLVTLVDKEPFSWGEERPFAGKSGSRWIIDAGDVCSGFFAGDATNGLLDRFPAFVN